MANGRVEVISSVERRRRWSSAQKQELVAATLEPGASVSAIAREAGVHPSQLYGWRRQLRAALPVGFAPVRICESAGVQFLRATHRNIYVRSRKASERVMAGIEKFLAKRLKLRINKAQSAVAKRSVRKFLGFSFTGWGEPRRRIAPQAIARFKARVRELTQRTRGASLPQIVKELSIYLAGWRGYFGFCQTPSVLRALDEWIRRRLLTIAWKQWKHGRTRFAELRRRGVGRDLAAQTAGSPNGPWRLANSPALTKAFPTAHFGSLGLASVAARGSLDPSNRWNTDPYVRWCGRGESRGSPLSRCRRAVDRNAESVNFAPGSS